jgi:hypothetical protein
VVLFDVALNAFSGGACRPLAETACTLHLDGKQLTDCNTYSFLIFLHVMKVRIHECGLVVLSIEGGRKGLRYTKGRDGGQEEEETKKGERTWNERESARARTKRRVQTNGRRGRDQDKHGGGGGGQGEEESERETCWRGASFFGARRGERPK